MNIQDDNIKRFISYWWIWFGAYISIGLIIVVLLPFPYDLISVFGLCILANFLRGRGVMKRYWGAGGIKDVLNSLSSSMSANNQKLLKFNFFRKKFNVECIKCGKKFKDEIELTDHNRIAHPT
jgi:hypothetical protein